MIRVLSEALIVLGLGTGLGLLVNLWHPDGLELGRDHFPQGPMTPVATRGMAGPAQGAASGAASAAPTAPSPAAAPTGDGSLEVASDGPAGSGATDTPQATAAQAPPAAPAGDELDPALVQRLAAKGLTGIGFAECSAAWRDELRALGAILFIDARDAEHYAAGHIPGAWQLDPFRSDRYLPALVPLLAGTLRIIVYCNGGECEDSESAALLLLQFGADPSAVTVYAGGITEWRERGMPVELGERDSGRLADGP